MRLVRTIVAMVAAASLAGCGDSKEPADDQNPTPSAERVDEAASPPVAYAQCISCHSVKPGVNGVGPSLHGVVGRKAASVTGYAYSEPLRSAGLTWDEATLDKWLAAPMKMVPGTKMVFPGMPDPVRRKAVIDYLKTLQ